MFVPVRAGIRPTTVSTAETDDIWLHHMSPDGRTVAYWASEPTGSALWRIDVGNALTATRR
jgi:hypothetical protein